MIEEKKIHIEEVKTITEHFSYVISLLHLIDGRVASCSSDNTINIFDPSNDHHCDTVIERHSTTSSIISICELDDGTIVSCSEDKSILIGNYIIKDAHDCIIYIK